MQPTYLPWIGYFDLMDQVDVFVILDTVQFVRQSWQNRNRVRTAQGVRWLTIPVRHAFGSEIRAISVRDDMPWRRDHFQTLRHSYARAPHWHELEPELRLGYDEASERLQDVNERFIGRIAGRLGVSLVGPGPGGRKLIRASELAAAGHRQELLVAICQELGADEYLSPPGASVYLAERDPFPDAAIALRYHAYQHPVYEQVHGAFVPFMSSVDLIANVGPAAGDILRSGRRPSLAASELHTAAD